MVKKTYKNNLNWEKFKQNLVKLDIDDKYLKIIEENFFRYTYLNPEMLIAAFKTKEHFNLDEGIDQFIYKLAEKESWNYLESSAKDIINRKGGENNSITIYRTVSEIIRYLYLIT